ncbi:MAG TPA: phenylalanine--tRNA ligase subunit alpha, partial [Clostridia bacterium]|nr:phenylalanine--tRNA ligase subunit alpha [Clostridia bacterium]
MLERLKEIRLEAAERLEACKDEAELEALNVSVLGRSGALTEVLRAMGAMHKTKRAEIGQAANALKRELEEKIAA